ncbi:MAG: Uncharacterised protein [Pseudidiomarina mangrovi]|nr:MAG: Uncharacterised protein [Pseudidiomarina mangrovi]
MVRWLLLVIALHSLPAIATNIRIAVVIDDLGNSQQHQRFASLPGPLTFAVLPHTPYAESIATTAQAQHEIIVHMPMQPRGSADAGSGMLSSGHNQPELLATLDAALATVPFARGINNHMGSELTADSTAMYWLMAGLAERGLYFLDSRTHADTVAETAADQLGLPVARRHVFLDNEATTEGLNVAWAELLKQAQQQGFAIAIGHPHEATYQLLKRELPRLSEQQIELVKVSALLR